MARLRVDIVSAEETLYSGEATLVVAPLAEGEAGILPGHSPLLAKLKAGGVCVHDAEGAEQMFYVSGGFLEAQPDHVIVLSDTSIRASDLDEARAAKAVQEAEQAVQERQGHMDYAQAQAELAQAAARLRVARAYQARHHPIPGA